MGPIGKTIDETDTREPIAAGTDASDSEWQEKPKRNENNASYYDEKELEKNITLENVRRNYANYHRVTFTNFGTLDENARLMIRNHFAKKVLKDVSGVIAVASEGVDKDSYFSTLLPYANNFFKNIRSVRDLLPMEPYTEILLAVYDGLAYKDKWADLDLDQYKTIYSVLSEYSKIDKISDENIAKAVIELEKNDISTTPFSIDLDEE